MATNQQDEGQQSQSYPEYPDPEPLSTPVFPWITQHHPIPPDEFPSTTAPLVFEGYIPHDDNQGLNTDPGLFNLTATSQQQRSQANDGNEDETDSNFETSTSVSQDEDDMSADEEDDMEDVEAELDDGIYTGTRSQKSDIPRKSYAPSNRRGTGFRGRGGWSKGLRLGPRPALEPSDEFNTLHKEATNAFIDQQDHEKALELILKAIAINPEVYSAHALLSEIYFSMGDSKRAVDALFAGAHAAPRDPTVWQQVADICLQRSALDRQTSLHQARYCFARLVQIDGNDFDSRFQRAAINRELGKYTAALKDLEVILKEMPRNSSVLRQISEVCVDMGEISKAKQLYEDAIRYYQEIGLDGDETLGWSDVNVYVDLIAQSDEYRTTIPLAIKTLRHLSRWLLGRESETYWDNFEDDREWDADDEPRRIEVQNYQSGKFPLDTYGIGLPLELRVKLGLFRLKQGPSSREEALAHFEWLEPDDSGDDANVYEYTDLFLEVAHALNEAKEHEQALRFFEPLKFNNAYSDTNFWLGIASSSYICDKKDQALECYEAAKASDEHCGEARTQLSKLYTERGEKDKAMENAREAVLIAENSVRRTERRRYERKDQRLAREAAESALRQAHKLSGPRKTGKNGRVGSQPTLKPRPSQSDGIFQPGSVREQPTRPAKVKRTAAENTEAQRNESILQLYTTLTNNTTAMRQGDATARSIWMDCAQSLIDDFRTNRVFYPYERHIEFKGYDRQSRNDAFRKKWMKEATAPSNPGSSSLGPDDPMPSVESAIPTDYRGILFSAWLDVFLEYALLLANVPGQKFLQQCYTIITAAQDCTIWYHDSNAMMQIYICYFTCALALKDEQTLFNIVLRWFMRQYQFCTDGYRLFTAMNLLYQFPNDKNGKDGQMNNAIFRSGPSSKFIFRQVMAIDSQLPEDYNAGGDEGPVPDFMRRVRDDVKKGDREETLSGQQHGENSDERVFKPREMDVVLLILYGHILYVAGSFPNALSYFYRAYTLDPKNQVVLLSMALSYMHQLLKRQNENRHMYLLQGWAFFEEYADARKEWASAKESSVQVAVEREIEFNRARCWQMLGMGDLAVRGYAKILAMGDGHSNQEMANYSMEAAYAIQTMYALNGDTATAKEITEKWLVVD